MDHLFDMRPARPGFRLQRLEVFNWGTFDSSAGQIYRFEPNGRTSLLVGHNGSGKSTLVDAILTLLVDSRSRNYNVAAGAKRRERTEKSYIRGAFDRTSDDSQASVTKYLRKGGANLTVLSAVFADEQLGKAFTLCQVLYLTADGSADKVYAIADEPRELKTDLVGLNKSDEIRSHLKEMGYQTTKTFIEYQGWLTRRTGMQSKAMDMFNQTVAVKDIQSLNEFIRKHMLEAQDWRDKVQRLLTHFNDLSTAHQELVRARKSEELLTPVEKRGVEYRQKAEALDALERELAAAEAFFPLEIVRLFEPEIVEHQERLAAVVLSIDRSNEELKQTSEKIRQLKNEIDLAGGERLKQIPNLIVVEQGRLELKKGAFTRFHDALKTCGINEVIGKAEAFVAVREKLAEIRKNSEAQSGALSEKYEAAIGQRGNVVRQLAEERGELEILERRKTNLPGRFTALRSQICADLNLDETALPFVAELVAVAPEEREWEASIEMVLKSFALSLLVPDRYYRRVRAYVEANRLADARGEGQRLDYLCVGKAAELDGDRIDAGSLIRKLQFKPRHDLAPWIRGEIQRRFNFRCCESVEEFNDVKRLALTKNRHVKFNSERHQKDDRARTVEPRYFVLGWDNTEKKRRIATHIADLETELQRLEASVAECKQQLDKLENVKRAATAALELGDFAAIDVKKHQVEIASLEAEKQELEQSNDAVRLLRERLRQAEADEHETRERVGVKHEEKALLNKQIEDGNRLVANARAEVAAAKAAGQFELHEQKFAAIAESLGTPPLSTGDLLQRRKAWEAATRQKVDRARKPLRELGEKLVNAMSRFLREFKEEQSDLDASVAALDSFLGLLEQVRQEDLPRHEKKFKDRLNDQVSQEVAVFNTELRQEGKQIEAKIGQLNKALAQLEYHPGTHMRLEPRLVKDREIEDFRQSLRSCLDESLEHTQEANEARFLRIQKLVERLADKEKVRWRDKVIDVRNWYTFVASEIVGESGEKRSSYDGSSGQSGGEKAKLAFTILVAAIAYQFDIDPSGAAPGRFQFVVVDEMFSKVDDQNAQYALKLFEQFGLQLLIVAPLDAKARITEPFVDAYLHVVKDAKTNRSQLYSMTAREYEEVVKNLPSNGQSSKATSNGQRRMAAK